MESLIERNINYMMDKQFGDKDPHLKMVTKLNLLYDGTDDMKESMEKTLTILKQNNAMEQYYINQEMFLTFDESGNIKDVNDIVENEEKFEFKEDSNDAGKE
jgi:hypothetical protein